MRPLHEKPPFNPSAAAAPAGETPSTSALTHSPSRPLPGSVAKLSSLFEGHAQQQASGPSPSSAAAAAARAKRQRTGPPLPEEWLQSPPLAAGGGAADAVQGAAPVERELFEEDSGEAGTSGGGSAADQAGREARLEAIRKKFGTRRFLPARELPPVEQRQQLGAAESDLMPDDYKLLRWDVLPVVLSGTSNGWCKNWVLSGQSGCVGLASSLQHLWVLGAGQTIFVEQADAVHAVRDDTGVAVRLGKDGWLTVKVPDAGAAAGMIGAINGRAATRAALRQRAGGPPAASVGQGGGTPSGSHASASQAAAAAPPAR